MKYYHYVTDAACSFCESARVLKQITIHITMDDDMLLDALNNALDNHVGQHLETGLVFVARGYTL